MPEPHLLDDLFARVTDRISLLEDRVGQLNLLETNAPTTVASHALVGGPHTAAGLTTGQPLRATSATTFDFGALDLANVNAVTGTLAIARLGTTQSPTFGGLTNSALTSGRVTYAGAGGLLKDDAGLTFDGTTDILSVGTSRPVNINDGFISIHAGAGGWATYYHFAGSGGTDLGGFGALGTNDALTYLYVGPAYNANWLQISATGTIVSGALTVGALTSGTVTDAATNTVPPVLQIAHRTSGVPAAGFGTELRFNADSANNTLRQQLVISPSWVVATDATRTARATLSIWDTAAREALRIEASGTAAKIGFLGAAAVVKQATITQTYATATLTHANNTSADFPAGGVGVAAGGWSTAANRDLAITRFNALRVDHDNLKQVVNSVVDAFQAYGLLG